MDATFWDQRYTGSELVWSAEPNRFVAEIVAPWRAGRALDLACGEGRNAIWLASRGWNVTAVDFSAVGLHKAAMLADAAGVTAQWIHDDAITFSPAPQSFDLVLISYLHLPHDQMTTVMTNAVDAVANGGALVVVAHALANLTEGVGGPQDPAVLPTPEQVRAWLSALQVERCEHVTRPVETPDGTRDAIDLVAVARRPRR